MRKSPRRLSEQVRDTVGEQVRDLPLHAVRLAMFGVGRALLLGDRMTRDYKEITEGGGVKPVIGRLREDVQHTAGKVVGLVAERVRGEEPEPEPEPARRTRTAASRTAATSSAARSTATEEISVGKPGGGAGHKPKHARPGPPPKPAKPGALGRHHAKAEGGAGTVAEPAPKPVPSEPKPEPAPQAEPAASPKAAEPGPAAPEAKPTEAAKARAEESKAPAKKPSEKKAGKAAFEPKAEAKPAAQAEAAHIAEDLPVPDYDSATLPQLRARLRGLSADQVKLLREYERKHAGREDVISMYERRIAKLNGLS
ncbi:hypothetical protein [Actinomadura sp. WMMA1423]|uniref:hypothetical protein n=1 Tax=Actinomadura sp. WMMA1423 TaxID=2591108 RepID=UPI00114657B9|nr:hypothetical protein [Actinomadura sp. WMMA1423]